MGALATRSKQTAQKVRHIYGTKPLIWSAGGSDSQPIPGGYILRELQLHLTGSLTTSANLAAAATAAGAEWGLVKKIQILAGTEIIREYTGEELRILSSIWYRGFPRPGLTLGATTTVIDATLTIPFWDIEAMRPMDTALNTSWYGALRINVVWGTFTDVASTGTAFSVTPQITWSMEMSTPGADTPNSSLPFLETRVQRNLVTGITAQNDYPVVIPTGLTALRSMLFYCKDSSGNDQPGKISTFKVRSLNTLIVESDFASLRDNALQRSNLREAVVSGAKASPMQDSQFDLSNYLYVNFAKDRRLTEAFSTFRLNDLRIMLNVSATITNLYVVTTYLLPRAQTN